MLRDQSQSGLYGRAARAKLGDKARFQPGYFRALSRYGRTLIHV